MTVFTHIQVGPRAVWKDPQHAFKTDEKIQVTGIPTLVQWTSGGPGARLTSELEMAPTPAQAETAARAFVSSHT